MFLNKLKNNFIKFYFKKICVLSNKIKKKHTKIAEKY